MGNRKERRLAAKSGANRRVKLDLFAEPSEDLGGSSAKDEAEKDVDAKLDAELPNLPSSSALQHLEIPSGNGFFGKQVENPLSLLGQYSDDDLDEGSNETTRKQDGSLVGDDNQVKMSIDIPAETGEVSGKEEVGGKELSPQRVDNHNLQNESAVESASFEDADVVLSNKVISDEKCSEVDLENQDPVCGASDIHQSTGVDSSCWKMVLHEESNRYYYWNTVTGETSWEVPDVLTLGTGLADEQEVLVTSVEESPAGNINDLSTASGVKLDDVPTDMTGYNGVADVTGGSEYQSQAFQSAELSEGAGSMLLGSSTVCAYPYDASMIGSYSLTGHINASAGICQDVHGDSPMISAQDAIDLPSHLLRHAESILDRLKLLQGSDSHQLGWISKHMLEIEVRISDIRSLLHHGLSLGPFWLHSEKQLGQLENAINAGIGEQNNRINGMHLMSSADGEEEKLVDGEKTKLNADVKAPISESHADMHDVDVSTVVQKTSLESASESQTLDLQQISGLNHSTYLDDKEVNRAISEEKTNPKTENQPGEDVDMDVDMEVEDADPEKIDIGGQLVTEQSLGPDSEFIPPPPDDEWIPPPPPDEPPEVCPPPPPSEPEPVQSIYNEQYSVAYGGSDVHYFDNSSADASGNSLYQLADGSQVAALNPAVYYTSASTVQPTSLSNPIESVVYYGLQNGVMPIVPVESAVSSCLQAPSGQISYTDLSSQHIVSMNAVAEDPLLNQQIGSTALDMNAGVAVNEVSSTSVVSAPPTVSVKEYVSAPFSAAATSATVTASGVNSDVPASLPKAHMKATKVKKSKVAVSAASSLRSNKKVSSLVDKWKAAKEELREEEEEQRETPLEILEKKRQREIEEWRAQQIASGEAKENANFQPLGGNWRERVKRKRARKGDPVETSTDVAAIGTTNSKQPDVNELSRDLPSGWQAYWDESSKKVYYANSNTSETTWNRPTR